MNNDFWSAPKIVTTPPNSLLKDIENYLGKDILDKYKQLLKYKDNKEVSKIIDSIKFIVERVEFIRQLISLEKKVSILDNPIYQQIGVIQTKISNNEIDGIDFNGFQYDLNALVYYLYNTCFDSVAQLKKSEYMDFKNYLIQKINDNKESSNIEFVVKNIIDDYNKEYGDGLRKDFIATIQSIDDSIKKELLNNVMIFDFSKNKFIKQKFDNIEDFAKDINSLKMILETIPKWSKFYEEQLQKWNSEEESIRLKKIADKLYAIRSKYTHNSIRSFLPNSEEKFNNNNPLLLIFLNKQEHLVCKQNCNFLDLLKKILISACNIKLDNLIKENNWY